MIVTLSVAVAVDTSHRAEVAPTSVDGCRGSTILRSATSPQSMTPDSDWAVPSLIYRLLQEAQTAVVTWQLDPVVCRQELCGKTRTFRQLHGRSSTKELHRLGQMYSGRGHMLVRIFIFVWKIEIVVFIVRHMYRLS